MEIITWKSPGLQQKKFDFMIGSEPFGTLTFLTSLSSNAIFVTNSGEIKFEHNSFWNNQVSVSRNGQPAGKMTYAQLSRTTLKLADGKIFRLKINYLDRNFRWVDTSGSPIVECGGRIWRGSVSRLGTITDRENEVLVSAAMVGYLYNSFKLNFIAFGAVALAVIAIVVFASE